MIEIDGMIAEIERLTAERDAARAEAARLRRVIRRALDHLDHPGEWMKPLRDYLQDALAQKEG